LKRRAGGRGTDELREVVIAPAYLDFAEGSALVTWGRTRVLGAATVLEKLPRFRQETGGGWITAEYSMLPRATDTRQGREGLTMKIQGRTYEIQRLIGRSPRAAADLKALSERTVILDCDVLQADGARTAAITGAFVALALALAQLRRREELARLPLNDRVAAVSLGLVAGRLLLDLDYEEDSQALVDADFVDTGRGDLVEVQATGEGGPFPAAYLSGMLELAQKGLKELGRIQEETLASWLPLPW